MIWFTTRLHSRSQNFLMYLRKSRRSAFSSLMKSHAIGRMGAFVQSYMVDVTPINSTLNDVLGHVCFMIGIMVTSKYGLHWNWRGMIVFTGIVVIIVDCAVALITVWDVFRHQWFWLGPLSLCKFQAASLGSSHCL